MKRLMTNLMKSLMIVSIMLLTVVAVEADDKSSAPLANGTPCLVTTTSDNGRGVTVAFTSGGGETTVGSKITVNTTQIDGYTFVGWYEKADSYVGSPLSTNIHYTFTVEGDTDLVAVYELSGQGHALLRVDGTKFLVSEEGETPQFGYYEQYVDIGKTVTLKYLGDDTFHFWKNGEDKVMSHDEEYTFTFIRETTLLAQSGGSEDGNSALVVFATDLNQVLSATTISATKDPDAIEFPPVVFRNERTFIGWDHTAEEIIEQIEKGDNYIVVMPKFVSDGKFSLQICYNGGLVETQEKDSGVALSYVAMDEYKGAKFSYWMLNGKIQSFDTKVSFWLDGNSILNAVYDGEQSGQVFTSVYAPVYKENAVHINSMHAATSDYKVTDAGFVRINAKKLGGDSAEAQALADTILNLSSDNEYKSDLKINQATHETLSNNGEFFLDLTTASGPFTVYLKSFVSYQPVDETGAPIGEVITDYSDMMVVTYPQGGEPEEPEIPEYNTEFDEHIALIKDIAPLRKTDSRADVTSLVDDMSKLRGVEANGDKLMLTTGREYMIDDPEAATSDFANWNIDFEISFSNDVKAGDVTILGKEGEGAWGQICTVPDVSVGNTLRLAANYGRVGDESAKTVTYAEACEIADYLGGAVYTGKNELTMTVKLYAYETIVKDGVYTETGVKHIIDAKQFTFESMGFEDYIDELISEDNLVIQSIPETDGRRDVSAVIGETLGVKGISVEDGVVSLDSGTEFIVDDEDAADSEFANWTADFVVTFDRDIKAGEVTLLGNYGGYGWIPVTLGDVEENQPFYVLKDLNADLALGGFKVTYQYLAERVKDFLCGAVYNGANSMTMSVQLVVYDEEGVAHLVGEPQSHTFEETGFADYAEMLVQNGDFEIEDQPYEADTAIESLQTLDPSIFGFDDLKVDTNPDHMKGLQKNDDGTYSLLTGREYKVDDENASNTPYANWSVDIEVTFDKDVKAGEVILFGKYDSPVYGSSYDMAVPIPVDIPAGSTVRLMKTAFTLMGNENGYMPYWECCESVQDLLCGAVYTGPNEVTMTAQLVVYETQLDDSMFYREVGDPYLVGDTQTYTFPETDFDDYSEMLIDDGDFVIEDQPYEADTAIESLQTLDPSIFGFDDLEIDTNPDHMKGLKKNDDGTYSLLTGREYKVDDENASNTPYANWSVDIEVTFDKDVKAGEVILFGKYDSPVYGSSYDMAVPIPVDIPAGSTVRLMKTAFTLMGNENGYMPYWECCESVQDLLCGAVYTGPYELNMTAKLVVYETELDESMFYREVGDPHYVGDTQTYLFSSFESYITDGDGKYDVEKYPETEAPMDKIEAVLPGDTDFSQVKGLKATEDGGYALDSAARYTINDDKAAESDYADWKVDFIVKFSKDVNAGEVTLMGYYPGAGWVAIPMVAANAGQEIKLLDAIGEALEFGGFSVDYKFLAENVPEFICGAVYTGDGELVMSVQLVAYENDDTPHYVDEPVVYIFEDIESHVEQLKEEEKFIPAPLIPTQDPENPKPIEEVIEEMVAAQRETINVTIPVNGQEGIGSAFSDVKIPTEDAKEIQGLYVGPKYDENGDIVYDEDGNVVEQIYIESGYHYQLVEDNSEAAVAYDDWTIDFEISFNKDIAERKVIVMGTYDAFVDDGVMEGQLDWIPFYNPVAIPKDTIVRLIKGFAASSGLGYAAPRISYDFLRTSVKDFMCGAAYLERDDMEMTVKLVAYETDGNGHELEGDKYRHELDTYTYTFGGLPTYEAKIGSKNYETLSEAITAAVAGQTVEIIKGGSYDVQSISKAITVDGSNADDEVIFNRPNAGGWVVGSNGIAVNLKGITWNVGNGSYQYFNGNAEDCKFNGFLCSHTDNTFTNCEFYNENGYNMWAYGNDVTCIDCKFTCPGGSTGSAINVYPEGNMPQTPTVTLENCEFIALNASEKYSAVYIKPNCTQNIVIKDCTANDNFFTNAISESKLWGLTDTNYGGIITVDDEQVWPRIPEVTFESILTDDVKYVGNANALTAGDFFELTGEEPGENDKIEVKVEAAEKKALMTVAKLGATNGDWTTKAVDFTGKTGNVTVNLYLNDKVAASVELFVVDGAVNVKSVEDFENTEAKVFILFADVETEEVIANEIYKNGYDFDADVKADGENIIVDGEEYTAPALNWDALKDATGITYDEATKTISFNEDTEFDADVLIPATGETVVDDSELDVSEPGEYTVTYTVTDTFKDVTVATKQTVTVEVIETFPTFEKKFVNTDKYLYRVGNVNNVALDSLFSAEGKVRAKKTSVEVTNVAGDAAGTFTASETDWKASTIKFAGTGVVSVALKYGDETKITLMLEVVEATNVTNYSELKNQNSVLISDIEISSGGIYNLTNATLYGNGFIFDVRNAAHKDPSNPGVSSNGVVLINNTTIDNVSIIGKPYTSFTSLANSEWNFACVLAYGGDCVITNSYVSNCASPVRTCNKTNLLLKNTTLKGGTFCNLDIRGGSQITVDGLTTINQVDMNDAAEDGKTYVGLGIVTYYEGITGNENITIAGDGLKQYNYVAKNQQGNAVSLASMIWSSVFGINEKFIYNDGTTKWINTGILLASSQVSKENITPISGYEWESVSLNFGVVYNGNAYIPLASAPSTTVPSYKSIQGIIEPSLKWNWPSNDECSYKNNQIEISFDEGSSYLLDTNLLTASKFGQKLPVYVKMNGVDYTNKSIEFKDGGNYTLEYMFTDPYNYEISSDTLTSVDVTYTEKVNVFVSVLKADAKHAEFVFGTNNTPSKQITIGQDIYVMPDDTSLKSTNVGGQTIYCPTVEVFTSDGQWKHSDASKFVACFPVFKDVITITDYRNEGTGEAIVYDGTTQALPTGLKAANPTVDFKWWSSDPAPETPSLQKYNGTGTKVLCYTSPQLGANAREEQNYYIKFIYKDEMGTTYNYYVHYHVQKHEKDSSCLAKGTMITLSDGSKKAIENMDGSEKLKVWDFNAGQYVEAPVFSVTNHGVDMYEVTKLTFGDGSTFDIIAEHGLFDKSLNKFVNIDSSNASSFVGHEFIKDNGNNGYETVTLTSINVVEEETTAYSIISVDYLDVIANEMFSLDPALYFLLPFAIDDNMKYDAEAKAADIDNWGLLTYEEFKQFAPHMTETQFYAGCGYNINIALGKGIITMDKIIEFAQRLLVDQQILIG